VCVRVCVCVRISVRVSPDVQGPHARCWCRYQQCGLSVQRFWCASSIGPQCATAQQHRTAVCFCLAALGCSVLLLSSIGLQCATTQQHRTAVCYCSIGLQCATAKQLWASVCYFSAALDCSVLLLSQYWQHTGGAGVAACSKAGRAACAVKETARTTLPPESEAPSLVEISRRGKAAISHTPAAIPHLHLRPPPACSLWHHQLAPCGHRQLAPCGHHQLAPCGHHQLAPCAPQ